MDNSPAADLVELAEGVIGVITDIGFVAGNTERYVLTGDRPDPAIDSVSLAPDGTRALAVHASLVADDGRGIAPDVDAEEMAALFPQPEATLVLGGQCGA